MKEIGYILAQVCYTIIYQMLLMREFNDKKNTSQCYGRYRVNTGNHSI